MKKTYFAVWYSTDEGRTWQHHMSCDNMEDAREERDSCKRSGEKTKIVKQDW